MKTEIETIIRTEDEVRLSVSEWDETGVWMGLQASHGSFNVTLTRAEAEQLLVGLQAVLAKEVTA
jgi:hypothetical protein